MRAPASATTCLLASALALAGCDTVRIVNSSGEEHGLLLDGFTEGVQRNDKAVVSAETSIPVGVVGDSIVNNELIGFTNRRPVAVRTAPGWTAMADRVDLQFAEEIAIPVTVWIVRGPFAEQRELAVDASLTTSAIWNSERMGVRFASFTIHDATGDPQAPDHFLFTCGDREALQADIGRTAGQINVYYVDRVDGGNGNGHACDIGGDFVAMGRLTGDELLVHELGHDFGLTHIDSLPASFDTTNVMHSASSRREFLTEGQLFRAHLGFESALNSVYEARGGQPLRDCERDEATPFCPRINTRIWPDGLFRDQGIPPVIEAPAPVAPPDPLDTAHTWLSTTCTTGEEPDVPPGVVEGTSPVEPFLLEALESGPGEEAMRQFEESAVQRIGARATLLAGEAQVGLSAEDLEAARRRGEPELLERARRDFVLRYRTRAARALGALGSQRAEEALAAYGDDLESPLGEAARDALAALRDRRSEE
jgi:hypothetical protein